MEGRYLDSYLKEEGADAPVFTDADMKLIGQPLDFCGFNLYYPTYVRADDGEKGYSIVQAPKAHPTMEADWLKFGPQIGYWGPRLVNDLWHPSSIIITENGCCCPPVDTQRQSYAVAPTSTAFTAPVERQ